MIKVLLIIFSIVNFNSALAIGIGDSEKINTGSIVLIVSPSEVAEAIMADLLSSLQVLKKQNKDTFLNIDILIRTKLLPYIAITTTAKLTLKNHWDNLNSEQKILFQKYITESLIKDYIGVLASYDKIDSVKIVVDPRVRHLENKAIVSLIITISQNSKPVIVALKLVYLDDWNVYDIVFAGVSLMSNYRAQFDSHIKRKGVNSLIKKIKLKLSKYPQ